MLTGFTVTVPANTTEEDPFRETFHLSWGFIDHFGFYLYPESVGLTHFFIEHLSRKLYPFDPDEDFSMPGHLIETHPDTELMTLPYDLEIVAWNKDDRYSHEVHIFIGQQRRLLTTELAKLLEFA